MYITILFVILFVLIVLAFFEDDKMQKQSWLLIMLVFVLTFLAAFRPAGVDRDYFSYLSYYENPNAPTAILVEPTFRVISSIARLCELPALIFVIYALLSIPLKIYSIVRLTPLWYISILFWFSHLYILQDLTQIRVAVSATIFLFSLPYLIDGKRKHYVICMTVAILFHYSALILLPLAFLGNRNLSRSWRWLLVVLPIAMYAFPFAGMELLKLVPIPIIQQKIQIYEELMIYEGVGTEINVYNVIALARLFAYYLLLWKYDYLLDKYPYISILLKVFCYSICAYVGLSFLPIVAMRVEELISIVDCILFPILAVLIRPHWLGRLLVIIYLVGVFMADIFLYRYLKF